MKIKVNTDRLKTIENGRIESGEYNITECEFEFTEEYEGLVKKAVFSNTYGSYKVDIENDKCRIASEVLEKADTIKIGVYAYKVENEELQLRYSPTPTYFRVKEGSYKRNANNSEEPTPSEVEVLESKIQKNADDISDIQEEQTTQNTNITNLQTNKADKAEIPTNLSDLNEDTTHRVVTDTEKASWNNKSEFSGSYDDLNNKPSIPTKTSDLNNDSGFIDKDVNNLTNYELKTNTGSSINLSINSSTYVMTLQLKNSSNEILSEGTIDLPLETMVVNATYDNNTKEIVLTLQNGTTTRFSVADLVSGLVSTTDLNTVLASYYTKTEIDNLLGNKVDKVAGKSLISDTEIERLANVDNYDDTEIQADIEALETELEETQLKLERTRAGLPKISGEGANITLNNTIEDEFDEPPLPIGVTEQRLPDEYQEVEYIESTGTQYIDTGILLSTNSKVEMKVLASDTDNSSTALFGYRASNTSTERFVIFNRKPTNSDFTISLQILSQVNNPYNFNVNSPYKILASKDGLFLNDDKIQDGSSESFNSNNTALIFGFKEGNNVDNRLFVGKLYYCKIYDNNTLLSDFIPCYRKSDNVVGLYNLVNKAFYTNIGTGIFSKGSDVNMISPNYPQEIKNVREDIDIIISNKNLLPINIGTDKKGLTVNVNADGTITLNGTVTYSGSLYISRNYTLKANHQYTLSSKKISGTGTGTPGITFWDSNISNWYIDINLGNKVTKTSAYDIKSSFALYVQAGKTYENYKFSIQLEEGSTATTYEQHQSQTFTFPLSQGQKLMEGDYLADDGVHHVRGQVLLNGTEYGWGYGVTQGTAYNGEIMELSYNNAGVDNKIATSSNPNNRHKRLCNAFSYFATSGNVRDIPLYSLGFNSAHTLDYYFEFCVDFNTTVADFKTWLSNNPITIEYELKTETIEPYTSAQQTVYNNIKEALSYKGQTKIYSTNEVSPTFKVKAYGDTGLILDELKQAMVAMGGV